MNLVDYALVTLDDTKLFLGITDSSKDNLIKLFINIATDQIEEATGRRFKETTYTDEKFDGNGEKEVLLPQYPVITFTSLSKNTAYNNSDSWEVVDGEEYFINEEAGFLTGVYKFFQGVENYKATFVAGYASIPYDLQFACMQLVRNLQDGNATGTDRVLERESLGDHTVVFAKTAESIVGFQKTIDKYRKPNL